MNRCYYWHFLSKKNCSIDNGKQLFLTIIISFDATSAGLENAIQSAFDRKKDRQRLK